MGFTCKVDMWIPQLNVVYLFKYCVVFIMQIQFVPTALNMERVFFTNYACLFTLVVDQRLQYIIPQAQNISLCWCS
jgi:hypothetical protein